MHDDRYIGQEDEPDLAQGPGPETCPHCGRKVEWPQHGEHRECAERSERENT